MDGGVREKQMADDLKAMVKQKASERRERKWGQLPTATDLSPSAQIQSQGQGQGQGRQDSESQDRLMSDVGGPIHSDDDSGARGSTTAPSETASSQAETGMTSPASSTATNPNSCTEPIQPAVDSFPEDKSEVEVNFTMIYLDYVVPFLFPFYRPCLLESSRGWMLVLLMKNRALFHTALSLANWLYAVLFDSLDGGHGACRRANWAELQAHQETAIRALQEDVRALNQRGVADAFRETVACIQSVIQLLEFEVAMADTANWQVHHDVSVVLFDQLITHHAKTETNSDSSSSSFSSSTSTPASACASSPFPNAWSSILDRIGFPFCKVSLENGRHILSSDQSAFKFYTAQLLWIDVVAATAHGEAPRLSKYHAELLVTPCSDHPPTIDLGEYVGCQSWVVLEIAEIARLAAWKRAQQTSGCLSMRELGSRSRAIEARLRLKMEGLEVFPVDRASDIYDPSAYHPVTPYSGFHEMLASTTTQKNHAITLHTRIWAQAAQTYLHVVSSGLQPSLPAIQSSVEATMALLRLLPSPLALRTLAWPFAVTGCMALPEHYPFFTGLVADMGALHVFGSVREALNVIQTVWEHRKGGCAADPMMWDIATLFSVLGHPSLLV
ncbi:fungal-specific transcription factor domain-containing protein [Xylaria venustula]|nr:fungal-specific transcription factor domain-containing protein [Xylaria venustula]